MGAVVSLVSRPSVSPPSSVAHLHFWVATRFRGLGLWIGSRNGLGDSTLCLNLSRTFLASNSVPPPCPSPLETSHSHIQKAVIGRSAECYATSLCLVFPLRLRPKGVSLSLLPTGYGTLVLVTPLLYLVDPSTPEIKTAHLGVKVFATWTATCPLSAVFAYFFVPELRALSLEQVDLLYSECTVLNSDKYRQAMLDAGEDHLHLHTNS